MKDVLNNIKRIINDGGSIYIVNKDGIKLDITDDIKRELNKSVDECIEDAHIMFIKKEI
jgi:hypothetical protein